MAELKPCEIPCPKCGHTDIHRVFRAKGSVWRCETYGRADNKYAGADTYVAKAWRDHIDHTCRCCKYRWQTLPLRKRRPTPPDPGHEQEVGMGDGAHPYAARPACRDDASQLMSQTSNFPTNGRPEGLT